MSGNENSAFFIEFFLGLPLEGCSTIESISINRYPTDTSRKSSDCGASFLKKVVPEFFRFGSRLRATFFQTANTKIPARKPIGCEMMPATLFFSFVGLAFLFLLLSASSCRLGITFRACTVCLLYL